MSKQRRKSSFKEKTVSNAKQQREKASSYGYLTLPKGVRVFTIKEKTRSILIDIIPYEVTDEKHLDRYDPEERAVPGTLWYKKPFKVHRGVGADNNTVVCRGTIKKKCPICEYVTERMKAGADWDEMKESAAKDRNLYAVMPLDSEEHEEEIYIWDISQYLFQNELNDQLEEDEDNGIFPDLEEGKSLDVKLKWKKFGKNMFPETRDITFEDRTEAYDESILDDVPNLDEVLQILSYQEMHDLFFEMDEVDEEDVPVDDDDDEPLEEDHKPIRRKKKPVEKEEEPEEEDEDNEDEEEEEEVEEKKPTRRRKPAKKKEEEDAVDEEEEVPEKGVKEKPTRKPTSKKDKENECPEGFTYGKDCEEHDECDECDKWADCLEEKEKQEAK